MPCLLRACPLQPASHVASRAVGAHCRSAWLAPAAVWREQQGGGQRRQRRRLLRAAAAQPGAGGSDDQTPEPPSTSSIGPGPSGGMERLAEMADLNQLQTALNTAIAADNFELAARIRDLLGLLTGAPGGGLAADWRALGILSWLSDRAESLGFPRPTGK